MGCVDFHRINEEADHSTTSKIYYTWWTSNTWIKHICSHYYIDASSEKHNTTCTSKTNLAQLQLVLEYISDSDEHDSDSESVDVVALVPSKASEIKSNTESCTDNDSDFLKLVRTRTGRTQQSDKLFTKCANLDVIIGIKL